jgi:hypothetical protein
LVLVLGPVQVETAGVAGIVVRDVEVLDVQLATAEGVGVAAVVAAEAAAVVDVVVDVAVDEN